MKWSIVTLPIETESDVVTVRQRVRRIAELIGFQRQDQTRIATAVSEIARNAFGYAGGGRAEISIDPTTIPQTFCIRITDNGRGIADLESILEGRYKSESGMGLGLIGARRLMDRFKIDSKPGAGTTVELGQFISNRKGKFQQKQLSEIAATLAKENSADPLTALRDQNRELMQSLEELRRREEESRSLNQELGDTNRGVVSLHAELDERSTQLRKAGDLKSRFLSNMTHEFRTPLNSILALSRLLLDRLDGDLSSEQERQVVYIRRSAENLLDLVNDLLDLAKVDAGKIDLKIGPFTVQTLFGSLRGSLRPLLNNPAVELQFNTSRGVPELLTDEAKVSQILRNLIANALKFTEAGEVSVSATYDKASGCVQFSVRDTGIGIAAEDLGVIFEEFTQVDTLLQKKSKGTGLGLPLSKSLAGLLRGTLRVDSSPGEGSAFHLSIPAVIEQPTVTGSRPQAVDRKKILVIDDDETFRYVIRQIIVNEPIYAVEEASDGQDGLKKARDGRPDAIILDLQMPMIDGFTVLSQLQDDPLTQGIPIVVCTSIVVSAELKSRLPSGTRVISKNVISRESVSTVLRDATRPVGIGAMTGRTLILNVDDQEAERYIKTRDLKSAGFDVVEARTGAEALKLVETLRPPVVLLDVQLPDINGFEVCAYIKKKWPEVMVLQTSATFTTPADRTEGLEAGADSYLVQPAEPLELAASVRALLRIRRADDELRRANEELSRDAQKRAAVEESLRVLNETLERRVAEEIARRAEVEEALRHAQKLEAIGHLTGGIAHDFNNLLSAISGSLEFVQRRITPGQHASVPRYLEAAQSASRRAAALTQRLLAFSRRQTLAPAPTDLAVLVAGMQDILTRSIGPAIALEIRKDSAGWPVLIDSSQLENALLNLCINARDAMPDGGHLTIDAANVHLDEASGVEHELAPGDYVMLCVADTGSGMDAETARQAFDPFFTTKPIGKGTGLGLSMIHGFVRQSGGQVRIESEIGRGTTVRLFLPRYVGIVRKHSLAPHEGARPRPAAGETVLIVDDEAEIRMVIIDALREMGYVVLEAGDGPAALKILRSGTQVDLLVTDVGLPGGINGRQLADAARAGQQSLRVLFITGYADIAALGPDGLGAGMAVLAKPFAVDDLVRQVGMAVSGVR